MPIKLNKGNINSYLNDISIFNFVQKNIPNLKGKVLDIGCGKQKFKKIITESNNVDKYIGLDLEEGKFVYSVKADVYWDGITIPISDESIDSILLLEVLEHCPDPKIVINEAFRVLKKGGVILISTPFIYQLHGVPFDYSRPTPFGLRHLLENIGFVEIKVAGSGGYDASLGQMIGIWISHRKMPLIVRKIMKLIFVPVFKILLWTDKKYNQEKIEENSITPGVLVVAYK